MASKARRPSRVRTLALVREHYDDALRALNRCRAPKSSIERAVIENCVAELKREVDAMEAQARSIIITFDTDADVLYLQAA